MKINFSAISKKVTTFFLFISSLAATTVAHAQVEEWHLRTLPDGSDPLCVVGGTATIQGIMCLLANVMSVTLTLLGIVGFVMFVFGSIKWMLSGGNSQELESAKKTITFAFIGLGLALCSFLIIHLIASFTGVSVIEQFFIPPSSTGVNDLTEWDRL